MCITYMKQLEYIYHKRCDIKKEPDFPVPFLLRRIINIPVFISSKIVPMQARFLVDEEKLNQTSQRFGQITKRCVLYRGEDSVMENGVEYQNVENYLKHL